MPVLLRSATAPPTFLFGILPKSPRRYGNASRSDTLYYTLSYLLQQHSHHHVCALFFSPSFFSSYSISGSFFMTGLLRPLLLPPSLPLRNFGPGSKILNQLQAAAAAAGATVGPLCSVFLTPRADLGESRCMRKTKMTLDSSSKSFCPWSSSSSPLCMCLMAICQNCQRVVDRPVQPVVIFSIFNDAPLLSVSPHFLREAHLHRVSAMTS